MKMKIMRHWKNDTRITKTSYTAAISLGALVWIGCNAKETAAIDAELATMPTTEELTQDAKHMAQLFKQNSTGAPFLKLDLGDQQQYTFVLHRLLHAGKTPSNSPRLFQRLRDIHAGHLSSSAPSSGAGEAKAAGEMIAASNAAGGGGTRCGHMLIVPGNFATNMYNADSSALMSCFNGMDYVSLDQAIYETDEDETFLKLLTSNFQEDFAGVEVRTPVLRGSVAAGQNHAVLVDSFGFAEDDTTGEFEATYTRYKTEADTPATFRTGSAGPFAAQAATSLAATNLVATNLVATATLDHPRDATGDGIIRLCYKRSFTAGTGDCDYAAINDLGQPGVAPLTYIAMMEQNASGQWVPSATERWPIPGGPVSSVPNLLLPLVGVFDAGTRSSTGSQCKIRTLDPNSTFATVTLRTTGGWCAGAGTADPTDGGQLFNSLRRNLTVLGNGPNAIPFGLDLSTGGTFDPLIDFGADCLQNLQDACVQIQVSTKTNCNDGVPGAPDFTRTASTEVCFDVRNSCFAAGTAIRRADGTTVPVEKVQVGDAIVANATGALLTVTATTRGVEPEPMVRLKDSQGHELLLTSKHPVITTMGAMPADEVTVMSQVETETGIASIVEVERVPYKGSVYNLSVGTPQEIAMISGMNRTMFAGGIRVGDNEMQFDMERQRMRASAKRELSPAWEADRKNAGPRSIPPVKQ